MVGYVSTSKKSAERRWPSRCSWFVVIELRSTSRSTEDSSGFSAVTMLPENSANRPRTFVTTRWRTTKPTSEWAGSMSQVPAT